MNDQDDSTIKDSIIKAIQDGSVAMRPKWHFVLRAILLLLGMILVVLSLLYLISFIIFALHASGVWFAPGFGFRGLRTFLGSLPWLLVALALVFFLVLEILVKKYPLGYRRPLIITVFGILALALLGGLAVSKTSFHRGLYEASRANHLPFAGGFYLQYGASPHDNLTIGKIIELKETGCEIRDRADRNVQVTFTQDTDFPFGQDLQLNDIIVVLGQRQDDSVLAIDVREITDTPPFREFVPLQQN
jgi:hypothetical protein